MHINIKKLTARFQYFIIIQSDNQQLLELITMESLYVNINNVI